MPSAPLYKVPAGSELVLDHVRWRVIGKDADSYAVESIDNGECCSLSFERVDTALAANDAQLSTPAALELRKELLAYTGGIESTDQLPDQERQDIRARTGLAEAMRELEEEGQKLTQRYLNRRDVRARLKSSARSLANDPHLFHGVYIGRASSPHSLPNGRSLQEMYRRYMKFDRNPVVLLRKHHAKGPQGSSGCRLTELQEQFIEYVLNIMAKEHQTKLSKTYEWSVSVWETDSEMMLKNFVAPSLTTVRARYNASNLVTREAGRNGIKYARNKFGAGSTDVRALKYGQRVATDQVYLSIFTNDQGNVDFRPLAKADIDTELAQNEICRLWLHVMFDVATRMPLAWVLTETADSDAQRQLLRMATSDKKREKLRYGCVKDPAPAVGLSLVQSDNGTATRNAKIYQSELGIGTSIMMGRTYHSSDNPFVESAIGTLQWEVLNFLPGYTGSRPGELSAYDGKKKATLTKDNLMGIITRYFVDEYPFRKHSGTGMYGAMPVQKLDEAIEIYGGIDAPDPIARRLHLGEKDTVTTSSEGVRVYGIWYNSTELQRFAAGVSKNVTVCLDPDDLREVTIFSQDTKVVMTAQLRMTVFADMTLAEAINLQRQTAERNPEKRLMYEQHLKDERARRAKESGLFLDPNDPDAYVNIEKLRRQSEQLDNVEYIPMSRSQPTVSPASVLGPPRKENPAPANDLPPETEVSSSNDKNIDVEPTSVNSENLSEKPAPMFAPIKKSKL